RVVGPADGPLAAVDRDLDARRDHHRKPSDSCHLSAPHPTKARTSPPTPRLTACLSVSRPPEVEMMAMPSPPSTRGRLSFFAYTRSPGLDTRLSPAIERSRDGPYLSAITRFLPTSASVMDHSAIYSSCWRISAM